MQMAKVFKSKNRKRLSFLLLPLVFTFTLVFVSIFVQSKELSLRLWSLIATVAFSAFAASLVHRIAVPFHYVLEIDQAELRTGKSTSNRKQAFARDQADCFIADELEREICIDTGRWRAPVLAPEVLGDATNFEAFLDAVAEYWPDVKVLSREQYQQRLSAFRTVSNNGSANQAVNRSTHSPGN